MDTSGRYCPRSGGPARLASALGADRPACDDRRCDGETAVPCRRRPSRSAFTRVVCPGSGLSRVLLTAGVAVGLLVRSPVACGVGLCGCHQMDAPGEDFIRERVVSHALRAASARPAAVMGATPGLYPRPRP